MYKKKTILHYAWAIAWMKWLVVNRFFRLKIRNLCDQTLCHYWNCDWNKTKIDARKSRNWCQWAWGNPRDKKDTDTAHCPRPLYLYFVTLWFLVCIQSYVTLSNLYFIILWFLCVRVQRRSFLIWKHNWTQLFSMNDWYGGIFTSLMKPST